MIKRPLITVSAAVLINNNNSILLAERPDDKDMAGMWEFPGGKIEQGETPEQALVRELKEELNIAVKISNLEPLTFVSYQYEQISLLMLVFICREWTGEVIPLEKQKTCWTTADKLIEYNMPPADLPIISILQKRLAND